MKSFFSLFYRSFGEYKSHIAVLAVLGFVGGFFGGIGINALVPLLSFALGQEVETTDVVSKTIKDIFYYINIDFTLKYLLILVAVLFVLKAVLSISFSYINGRILADYEEKKRNKLFKAMIDSSWGYLLGQKLGHLETVLMTDVTYTRSLMILVSSGFLIVTNLIVYTFIAVNISFYITLMTFAIGGGIFLALFRPIVSRVKKISAEDEQTTKQIAHYVNESILGMKTIKAMSSERSVIRVMGDYFKKIKNLRIRSALANMFGNTLTEPISVIFLAVVFAISYKTTEFSLPGFLVVMYVSKQIFVYLDQLQALFVGASSITHYAQKILDYEETANINREQSGDGAEFIFNDSLQFRAASFSYKERKDVLKNLSFTIKRGSMVGIIGPSGAGKTTIVDLILRLFSPTSGEILMDGKNVESIGIAKWREKIGYVSQDVFLMNESVADNIRFYDDSISDEDVQYAAKMANIYDTIQTLPDKFKTNIGERGILLSGGQRQRIAIARALARKPQILIFDEATSALDNESEQQIQRTIRELKGKMTVIVIAHRLSTITNSDALIVLQNGKISEQGAPQALLQNKDSYFYKAYNIRNQ